MNTKIMREVAPTGRQSQSAGFLCFIIESAKLTAILGAAAGLLVCAEAVAAVARAM